MIVGLFAVDDKGNMGNDGGLPWPHNKDDMQWFKQTTQDQIVVMGRGTWNSIDMPKPLPGRLNVLVTNNFIDRPDIEQLRGDVCDALKSIQQSNKKKNIFVIGGPTILLQAKPVLERVLLTRIPGEYMADVSINIDEFLDGFNLLSSKNLGTCIIEEYENGTIQKRARARARTRSTEDRSD